MENAKRFDVIKQTFLGIFEMGSSVTTEIAPATNRLIARAEQNHEIDIVENGYHMLCDLISKLERSNPRGMQMMPIRFFIFMILES